MHLTTNCLTNIKICYERNKKALHQGEYFNGKPNYLSSLDTSGNYFNRRYTKMKIMSFNTQHCLNFLTRKIDFQIMADAIKKCDADIIGLNEMRDKGEHIEYEKQTEILAELIGFKYHYFAKAIDVDGRNPYGNALISKYPIISSETILVPEPEFRNSTKYETRCLLKAKLEGGITVLVSHFGLNSDEQRNAVNIVLENIEKEKCILMGDFNVLPDNEVLEPIRKVMKDTADCFSGALMSYPSDKPNKKIDYIFVSPDIEVVSADIPAIIASDHRPHVATVNIFGA